MTNPMKNNLSIPNTMRHRLAAALLFCLSLAILLSACTSPQTESGIAIPQGMQDATGSGTGYHLFIPQDWRIDHSTGVTIATYSAARITFASFDSEREPIEYWETSRNTIEAMFSEFRLDEEASNTLLGKNAAIRYKFSGIYHDSDNDGQKDKYGVTQYISKKGGRMYVLTYMAPYEKDYEQYTAAVEAVVSDFLFTDANTDAETPNTPTGNTENAPEGMKDITNSDIHNFHLYIPETWIIDLQNGTVSAYVSENDHTSISFVKNYPTNANTLPEYYANLEKMYQQTLLNYQLIEKEIRSKATTSALDSLRYEFRADHNGISYHFFQEIFVKGSYVYTFTYTATDEWYETHLAEANTILANITF